MYELCIVITIVVTIVLILINLLGGGILKNPYILVINSTTDNEEELTAIIKENCQKYKLKSRNYTLNGIDYIYQVETKKANELTRLIRTISSVKQFSLIEYDNEDVI